MSCPAFSALPQAPIILLTTDDVVDAVNDYLASLHLLIQSRRVKQTVDLLAPYIVEFFNRSLSALLLTLLSASRRHSLLRSWRSRVWWHTHCHVDRFQIYLFYQNFSSDLLIVIRQLTSYLSSSELLPSLQSAFRPGHSTETAVLWVLSDILFALLIAVKCLL